MNKKGVLLFLEKGTFRWLKQTTTKNPQKLKASPLKKLGRKAATASWGSLSEDPKTWRENRKWWEHQGTSPEGPTILIISCNRKERTKKKQRRKTSMKKLKEVSQIWRTGVYRGKAPAQQTEIPHPRTHRWETSEQWDQIRSHKLPKRKHKS